MEFNTIIDFGLIFAVLSLFVMFIGKGILKVKKDVTGDPTSEFMESLFFLVPYFLVPVLIIYCINNLILLSTMILVVFTATALIVLQGFISFYLGKKLKEKNPIKKGSVLFLFSLINIVIIYAQYLIYMEINLFFFLVISFLVGFVVLVQITANHNVIFRSVKIKMSNKRNSINGIILRFGKEFLDLELKEGKIITINKSQIISIEDI